MKNIETLKKEYQEIEKEFKYLKEKSYIFKKESEELENKENVDFEDLEKYKKKLYEAKILEKKFLENAEKMKQLEKDLEKYKNLKIGFFEILGIFFIFKFIKNLFSEKKD